MPQFSIILPCFNAADTLPQTLASLQAQTLSDWEAICVDDGSDDQTCEIIATARRTDPRIKLARTPESAASKGPSSARNHGAMARAKGEILAFCDADDLWSPDKLAQVSDAFEAPDTDAVFAQIAFFEDDPSAPSAYSTVPKEPLSIAMLLGENPVCTMSNIAIRRRRFIETGGFDRTVVHNEDLEWLIRLVGQGARVIGLPVCQTWYRTSPHGLSADLSAMAQGRKAAIFTAAMFGHRPTAASHAIYQRYLARRALRLGHPRTHALGYALGGLRHSPKGFFSTPKRGVLTLGGAMLAIVLPQAWTKTLFSQ